MFFIIKRINFDKRINKKIFNKNINGKKYFTVVLRNNLPERTLYKKQLFKEKIKITLMPEYCSTCLWRNNSEIEIFDLPKITHQLYKKLKQFSDDFEALMRDSLNFEYDDDYAHNEETNDDFYNSKEMNDFTDLGYFICNKLKELLDEKYYDIYFYDIQNYHFNDNVEPAKKI